MLEKAAALPVEPRQGRQWHAGQAGPGAPTGCNMEAAAFRVEAMLLRISAREMKLVLVALAEYKDALASVVIRRLIRGDGAMEWLCCVGEGGGLEGGALEVQAGHAGCREATAAALLKMMAVGAVALRVEPRQGKEAR